MRKLLFFGLLLIAIVTNGQQIIPPTNQFTIDGSVKAPFTFQLKDAGNYKLVSIDSVAITNHLKEPRNTIKNLRGILLKDILAKVELNTDQPKLFSEFYFVCTASDNYKVVFSWNEIFNTATGNNLYIIIEKDGQSGEAVSDRIVLLSATDEATGRRFVKGLSRITVKRAD